MEHTELNVYLILTKDVQVDWTIAQIRAKSVTCICSPNLCHYSFFCIGCVAISGNKLISEHIMCRTTSSYLACIWSHIADGVDERFVDDKLQQAPYSPSGK